MKENLGAKGRKEQIQRLVKFGLTGDIELSIFV
jgi:hypothetical protein